MQQAHREAGTLFVFPLGPFQPWDAFNTHHAGVGPAAQRMPDRILCGKALAEGKQHEDELQTASHFDKVYSWLLDIELFMMRHKALKFTDFALLIAACTLAFSGCRRAATPERVGAMGTPLAVGQLTYTALETEWRDVIDAPQGQRVPKNRFLLVHVTVTNASSEQKAAPLLQLLDAKGTVHPEIAEGDGVPDWMGYLRLLQPKENRFGRLLFDVPQGAYKLRVSSGGDPENEQTALIDLPLQLNSEVPRTSGAGSFSGAEGAPQLPEPVAPPKK